MRSVAFGVIASGMGVAVLADSHAKLHLESGRLVNPFDVKLPSGSAYYLVYPQGQGKDLQLSDARHAGEGAEFAGDVRPGRLKGDFGHADFLEFPDPPPQRVTFGWDEDGAVDVDIEDH